MGRKLSAVRDDAVRRKQRFQVLHPDVAITASTDPTAHWVAVLPGGREVADYHLDSLLDELGELEL